MIDKIREDFLDDILKTAEQMHQESVKKIEEGFCQELPNIADTLLTSIMSGLEHYHKLALEGHVGTLNYLYFSFLRTSIVFGNANYRLDFYDDRNRISLVECAEKWNFDYIFRHFNNIYNTLNEKFEEQTRVPGYELDYIIYDLAETYKKIADKKIDLVLQYILERDGKSLFGDKYVKFYKGDFLDQAISIV